MLNLKTSLVGICQVSSPIAHRRLHAVLMKELYEGFEPQTSEFQGKQSTTLG